MLWGADSTVRSLFSSSSSTRRTLGEEEVGGMLMRLFLAVLSFTFLPPPLRLLMWGLSWSKKPLPHQNYLDTVDVYVLTKILQLVHSQLKCVYSSNLQWKIWNHYRESKKYLCIYALQFCLKKNDFGLDNCVGKVNNPTLISSGFMSIWKGSELYEKLKLNTNNWNFREIDGAVDEVVAEFRQAWMCTPTVPASYCQCSPTAFRAHLKFLKSLYRLKYRFKLKNAWWQSTYQKFRRDNRGNVDRDSQMQLDDCCIEESLKALRKIKKKI